MDKERSCANKCVFCFIDQLPKGMRETLYFKDDDARMSFLMGNYITLTNLSGRDIERITDMRLSPINVSVHATDPEIRRFMLGNKRAGECFDILKKFAEGNISLNCQIVICPGINDGDVLSRTLADLVSLAPQVNSVSVVPVGLTRYRQGLALLKPVDEYAAKRIIEIVEDFGGKCLKLYGSRIVYAADELYIKAKRAIPEAEYYEDYPQLENGVGLIRLFTDEFMYELERLEGNVKLDDFTIATGISAAPFIARLVDELMKKCNNIVNGNILPIENTFFGNNVNVTGLITGGDLIDGLKTAGVKGRVLISEVMLRYRDTVFLDDVTVSQAERELGVRIIPVPNNGPALLDAIINDGVKKG